MKPLVRMVPAGLAILLVLTGVTAPIAAREGDLDPRIVALVGSVTSEAPPFPTERRSGFASLGAV